MAERDRNGGGPEASPGGGLNAAELQRREKDELAGTGGSSGAGTVAGSGDPSGGTTDRDSDVASAASGDGGDALGKGKVAAGRRGEFGSGEALGTGAGRANVGSGTKSDRGDVGGGGRAAASPGAKS